jgi:TRIAD3 protein (E3 ubiquitin-protein ligase RNF216)
VSQDRAGKAYRDVLEGFVSAGTRHGRSDRYVNDCRAFLQFAFPTAPKGDIEERFRHFRWDLFDTAADIVYRPPRRPSKRPRQRPELLAITSPYASHLVLKCLTLDAPAFAREDLAIGWRIAAAEAQRTGCVFECTCCFEDVPFEKLVQCPRGHLFCRDCLEHTAGTVIGEGRASIRCLSVGADCDCDVSILELERALPRAMLEKLTQTETLNAVMSVPLDNLVKCHSCGMPSIYERCRRNNVFKCPTCNADTCVKCGKMAHPALTCRQFQSDNRAALVAAKMNEALVRTCPNCHAQFMKEVGCNRMECPRCAAWFCYYCRKLIPRDVGYAHFWKGRGKIPPGVCPLFVDNKKFNRTVVRERKAMIEGLLDAKANEPEQPAVDKDDDVDEEEEEEAAGE